MTAFRALHTYLIPTRFSLRTAGIREGLYKHTFQKSSVKGLTTAERSFSLHVEISDSGRALQLPKIKILFFAFWYDITHPDPS